MNKRYVCVYSYICVPQELHFISNMEQIYHLIKGKRAGMLAVPELSLLISGSGLRCALVEGNLVRRVPTGTFVWLDVLSAYRQLGHGGTAGLHAPAPRRCFPSPAGFRGISVAPVPAPGRGVGGF